MLNLELLKTLADGEFHSLDSLQDIAETHDVAACCEQLSEYGLTLEHQDTSGYRLLNPPELLERERIMAALSAADFPMPNLEIHPVIDSTNKYLLGQSTLPHCTVCLAEFQTAGRGRQGRQWLSPYGSGLCLSILWNYETMPSAGLSLALGVALARVFHKFGAVEAGLKWPNDALWQNRKLSGLLVESRHYANAWRVVAGVGVNINLPAELPVEQAVADLNTAAGCNISRNQLAAELIQAFFGILEHFETGDFARFMQDWAGLDILYDKKLTLLTESGEVHGIGRGVSEAGALLLECNDGLKSYNYGEARIKR